MKHALGAGPDLDPWHRYGLQPKVGGEPLRGGGARQDRSEARDDDVGPIEAGVRAEGCIDLAAFVAR
jgi:hypothetical protein